MARLTDGRIRKMRAAYVDCGQSLAAIAAAYRVPLRVVADLAAAGAWRQARAEVQRLIVEDAIRAYSETGETDIRAATVRHLRQAALDVAHRVLGRALSVLDADDCSASDLRSVATAAEAADRVARRELDLPVERSDVDVALGRQPQRDMWAVIAQRDVPGQAEAMGDGGSGSGGGAGS